MNVLSNPALIKNLFFLFFLLLALEGCGPSLRSPYQNQGTAKEERIDHFYQRYKNGKNLKAALENGQKYLPYIHQIFYEHGLPPELAYLPLLESGFRTSVTSPSGAKGMWQFTEGTAKDFGLKINWLRDERLDWKKSTVSAARYLKQLGKRFDNNWELALAGYNGGPNYVARLVKQKGQHNYWALPLRKETYEYVPKYIAMLRVAEKHYPQLYFTGAPKVWIASRT
ncbi:MAG: lytic transglycosylase domain-containing protein [SAR324 cluster bacterium]|nr:lytic transglycosylase domain-containing protein [SAR324 cluster bacterium]